MAKRKDNSKRDLCATIRQRYRVMVDADSRNRNAAIEDLKFVNVVGEQWTQTQKSDRGADRCLEFNKIRPTVKRVVNEMRKNRPSGKVVAVEDADKKTADVLEGLCRNIWNNSDADTIIDYAGEYQVAGGYGAWRITTEYSSDEAFDQDICIEPIKNPFCLYADPNSSDPIKRDARDWILTDRISKEAFEKKYKDVQAVNFDAENSFDDDGDWQDEETVRIVEYWYKEPVTRELWLLKTGETVDAASDVAQLIPPENISRKRTVQADKILMCIASGNKILEGPTEWVGKEFPFIVVYGDWLVIDGKIYWSGLTRHAKDAQRVYNAASVAAMEYTALSSKAKYWATAKQALGNTEQWAEANAKNLPAQVYTPDPLAPGPPVMMQPPQVPMALVEEMRRASEDIKAVTGIFDASLGAQGNETSGKAILSRQQQGEVATFNFSDNMAKGIRRTYEILIDIIPKVYDTERSVRILGTDGSEDYKVVNQIVQDPATGQVTVINDLNRGKYDVAVSIGPSFTTQRQEAAETYTNLMQAMPTVAPFIADIAVKAMDLPYAEQVSERLKAMLPPQLQQLEQKDGKPDPNAVMAQAQAMLQQAEQHGQLVQAAQQELEQEKNAAAQQKAALATQQASLQGATSDLEVKRAQFDADVSAQLAKITMAQAQLIKAEAGSQANEQGQAVEQDRAALQTEVQGAVADIKGMAVQFMQDVQGTMLNLHASQKPPARVKRIERQGGAFVPVYEDQAS